MTDAENRPLYRLLQDFALFNHAPEVVADGSGLPHAWCSCGWGTLPIPSPFQFAVWDALAWHQRKVNEAIDTWQAFRDIRARGFADDVETWIRNGWAHGGSNPEPAG